MESYYLDRPLNFAHRGASHEAPENTLAAFLLATAIIGIQIAVGINSYLFKGGGDSHGPGGSAGANLYISLAFVVVLVVVGGYVFRDALQNMQRNVLVVTGAMIAVFISLSLAFGAVVLNDVYTYRYIENKTTLFFVPIFAAVFRTEAVSETLTIFFDDNGNGGVGIDSNDGDDDEVPQGGINFIYSYQSMHDFDIAVQKGHVGVVATAQNMFNMDIEVDREGDPMPFVGGNLQIVWAGENMMNVGIEADGAVWGGVSVGQDMTDHPIQAVAAERQLQQTVSVGQP